MVKNWDTNQIPESKLNEARNLVEELTNSLKPFAQEVEDGNYANSVFDGVFPIEGIKFVRFNHYHLLMNDSANLNYYVTKARSELEMEFFHYMAAEEMNHVNGLFLLTDAMGISRKDLMSSYPNSMCLFRTNYFSRLALYGTPGEIALGILLNFPVWAAGVRKESAGLKKHYGFGKPVKGTDKIDTDILDRFLSATDEETSGFNEKAIKIIARDLQDNSSKTKLSLVAKWAVETEKLVWDNYYAQGLKYAKNK